MRKQAIIMVMLLMILVTNVFAQVTWHLPANRKDTLYNIKDDFNIPRPALSMRGFDNQSNDSLQNQYSNTTYGVKQVLESVYGLDGIPVESSERTKYLDIIGRFNDNSGKFRSFTNNSNIEFNSSVLESRAFLALMSFIIEKNPTVFSNATKPITAMPNADIAMDSLMAPFHREQNYFTDYGSGNPWQQSTSLMEVARAWDLSLCSTRSQRLVGDARPRSSASNKLNP